MPFRPIFPAALLLLAACSPSDPAELVDAGYDALNSGQHETALSEFDSALSQLEATHPSYVDAKLGRVRAKSYVDAEAAAAEFLAFAETRDVQAGEYRTLVTDLVAAATARARSGDQADTEAAADMIASAVQVLEAGSQAYPEDEIWTALINQVGNKAEEFGASDALASLKGLGYVGGD